MACPVLVSLFALVPGMLDPTERVPPPPPEPTRYELHWSAPEGCPEPEAVRRRIGELVTQRASDGPPMIVDARVSRQGEHFRLTLHTAFAGRHSERHLEAQVCDELGETTALVIAVALKSGYSRMLEAASDIEGASAESKDDGIAGEFAEPLTASDRTPRANPSGTRGSSSETESREAWVSAPTPAVRAGLGLGSGSLPRIGGNLQLGMALLWPRLRLELDGSYAWPRLGPGPSDTSARYQLGAVSVRGCARPHASRFEFSMCVGLEGGVLRVDTRAPAPRRSTHASWLAPLLASGLIVRGRRWPRLGFWGSLEAAFSAHRTRLLDGRDVLWTTSWVDVRLVGGLEVRFGREPS